MLEHDLFEEITEQPLQTASEQAGLTPIKDNGHIILTCSNCGKNLVDVWSTHADIPVVTKLIARCCFCEDQSFPKEINGVFHVGAANGVSITSTKFESESFIIITNQSENC
jgi:hypothetical protein